MGPSSPLFMMGSSLHFLHLHTRKALECEDLIPPEGYLFRPRLNRYEAPTLTSFARGKIGWLRACQRTFLRMGTLSTLFELPMTTRRFRPSSSCQ